MGDPTFISRSSWGAKAPTHPLEEMPVAPIGNLYHHSTGATLAAEINDDPADDQSDYYPAWMRSIQRYHQHDKGWIDMAYNFAVDPHGRVFEGRGWHKVGAHAGVNTLGHNNARNSNTHGVVLLGDSNQPGVLTEAAKHALRWLLDQAAFRYGPQQHFGHRDLHPTDCPGAPLYVWQRDGLADGAPTLPPAPPVPADPSPPTVPNQPGWEDQLIMQLPQLGYGDHGQAVRNLQGLLTARGYSPGAVDGAYGPRTRDEVKRLQANLSIAGGSDGIVGRNTWTALLKP